MLTPFKNFDDIQKEMRQELKGALGVTDFTPGSVSSMLVDTYASREELLYEYLERCMKGMYLSSAEGAVLDLIGELLDCKRGADELDENFRYRISKKVYTAANANQKSIINTAKSIAGVKDVIISEYTKGTGSFTAFILTDEIDPSPTLIEDVRRRIGNLKAAGVEAIVDVPNPVPIDLTFTISYSKNVTSVDNIKADLKEQLQSIFDTQEIGGSMLVNDMIYKAQSIAGVTDIFLTDISIEDSTAIIQDVISFEWDERPFIRTININTI